IACLSIALLTVRTLSQTPRSSASGLLDQERLRNMTEGEKEKEIQKWREQQKVDLERLKNMTEQEKKRYFEKRRRQRELERQRRRRESKKRRDEREREMAPLREQRKLELEQRRKEFKNEEQEVGGHQILVAKYALGASEEQWKLIQPKLEKVQQLRDLANSGIGAWVVSSSESGTGPGKPAFQWKKPWKDRSPDELTEAQKLAQRLRTLLERKNTTPEAFKHYIAALREARRKEAELERPIAEARRELREILTTRQEAILVLLG
ncbi:MAG: hypothetical protein JSW47_11905, partial [Phycisphaerales bacterium]